MTLAPRTIVVPRLIRSVNDWMYQHWRAYAKERDAWFVMLRVQLRAQHPPQHPVRISICSLRMKLIDYGNLVGGAKPIPDCLKRLGYIRDDSPAWFHCDYEQLAAPAPMRATIIHFLTPVPT